MTSSLGARCSGPLAGKGLLRPRLSMVLDELWTKRLGVVVAPPGSGKTTLLASWSKNCGAPLAWYRAEPGHPSRSALLDQIYRASAGPLGARGPWNTVEEAVDSIAERGGKPGLLVVDDMHVLAGTPAEAALAEFVARLPPNLRVLVATRQSPALNLSRLRVEDALVELSADDLRFRIWETESLFRDHYGRFMLPVETTLLTQKTGGWAAGLQLFHLATRDRSPRESAQVLASFSAHSGVVAEYLAENVVAGLPASLVDFMVLTCPLAVLTSAACDELSGRSDSSEVLQYLESRQLFVTSADGGVTYRYHEIMRNHLDGCLVARLGEPGAREWHYRAGRLLLAGGFEQAALRALCRAEAWERAGAVLARIDKGTAVQRAEGPIACLTVADSIPPRLLESDPWVGLARARCHVASGHLGEAVEAYRTCESLLPSRFADRCREEMVTVAAWTTAVSTPAPGWSNALRRAVARDPMRARAELPEPGLGEDGLDLVVTGLAALLAGRLNEAQGSLQDAAMGLSSPVLGLGVRIAKTLADLLAVRSPDSIRAGARRALAMAGEAERLGSPWLARQAYGLLALAGRPEVAAQISAQCAAESDLWGATIAQLLEAAGRLALGQAPVELASRAAANARTLGAGVLEAWALACGSLAEMRAGNPTARQLALGAEATARLAGVPGAQAIAHLSLGYTELAEEAESASTSEARAASPGRRPRSPGRGRGLEHMRLGRSIAQDCGLGILRGPPGLVGAAPAGGPPATEGQPAGGQPAGHPVGLRVRCLGELSASWGDRGIDLGGVRPRARALLAVLALNYPLPVHCEVLVEALWPGSEPRTGARNLQTAVSSLRRVLRRDCDPLGTTRNDQVRPSPNPLIRRGEAYVLEATSVDVAELRLSLRSASAARKAKDVPSEMLALEQALASTGAELLPEFGPADWVVRERERLGWDTIDSAERLAGLRLTAGRPLEALTAARTGLELDQYRESLWRLAISAAEMAEDHGLALTLRSGRAEALNELGVPVSAL